MSEGVLTRGIGTVTELLPQARAASSGRFQRVATARWRERIGAPVRDGRPSAVTPELAEEGKRLLRAGKTIAQVCSRLGVGKTSWYRYVHREGKVRPYTKTKRPANSISPRLERKMVSMDKKGLARVVIAERLGLHINTVVKYLLRAGRPRKR